MNSPYDWTQFRKQTFIHASPEAVFNAWTKPGEIIKWFVAQADYTTQAGNLRAEDEIVQAGDCYYWRWHQKLDIRGEILKVEAGRLFQFTFGEKEEGSDEKIIVTVKISQIEPGTTLLELDQENMADTLKAHSSWHLSCNLGWSFFMTNLKALLEHNVDLREHSEERASSSRAVTLP